MSRDILSTSQKALHVNMELTQYGTLAEIGAGQEVARWFFSVGGASGTIAKSISAYDMVVSDAIYGAADRYVSRQRLTRMLEYEYQLLQERLQAKRGKETRFFAFANTVTATSFTRHEDGRGWMGIRFQSEPVSAPSQVIIHVRMLDQHNLQQQEALGILGVNLIHGAYAYHNDPVTLIEALMDNLSNDRIEVDMIKFSGPAFAGVDNRIMSLELVRLGLANSAMFTADGEVVQASEVLYNKPILVSRGSFRPVTRPIVDMVQCARATFVQEPEVSGKEIVVLLEMTLRNLGSSDGGIHHRDFLDRVDLLGALGQTVLISNYGRFYRLAAHLSRHTREMIGITMGLKSLRDIFDEKYYTDLDGGILESFGRLFKNDLKLYIYPMREPKSGALFTAANLQVAPNLHHLYLHLLDNRHIQDLRGYDDSCLPIFSKNVLASLQKGDGSWEACVPPKVAEIIKQRGLFGYGKGGAG